MKALRLEWVAIFLSCGIVGCSGGSENREVSQLDADAAAARAMVQYDSDQDGFLSKTELKGCPAVLARIDRFDLDLDGQISQDDLKQILGNWEKLSYTLIDVRYLVRRRGKPLQGATVRLIPEEFMGEKFGQSTGVTGSDGVATLALDSNDLPEPLGDAELLTGVPCGIYRVQVTHPNVDLPAKYNTKTTLSRVVFRRDSEAVVINL